MWAFACLPHASQPTLARNSPPSFHFIYNSLTFDNYQQHDPSHDYGAPSHFQTPYFITFLTANPISHTLANYLLDFNPKNPPRYQQPQTTAQNLTNQRKGRPLISSPINIMHLPRETAAFPNLGTRTVGTLMSIQAIFFFALKPKKTWCLACEQSPSFNLLLTKPHPVHETAVGKRALPQNVVQVALFLVSQNLHK
jgi:hypothetical protein